MVGKFVGEAAALLVAGRLVGAARVGTSLLVGLAEFPGPATQLAANPALAVNAYLRNARRDSARRTGKLPSGWFILRRSMDSLT